MEAGGSAGRMAGIRVNKLTEVFMNVSAVVVTSEGIVNIVDLWPCAVFETDPAIGLRADMKVEL